MIHTLAVHTDGSLLLDIPIHQLNEPHIQWYWVDFDDPTLEEASVLKEHFGFHPLAVEDCLHYLQRPKLDYYEDYRFFVLHAITDSRLKVEEVDLFVADRFVVSFHFANLEEIDSVRERLMQHPDLIAKGPGFIAYKIIDKLVDSYFPIIQDLEEKLARIESTTRRISTKVIIDQIYKIRSDLSKLRRSVVPMSELLYRVINSERIIQSKDRVYFSDIHDHLIKLTHMIESIREITADIRDSYLSLNSYRMNRIMMTLTVITTIFMPLTFIAGVYGMNFEYMPELKWRYGYFIVLGIMFLIGSSLFLWFKYKGWFNQD
ncbi:magnesium/cobalt transporter CorA [Thermoflavimicrobium dichotomicum]|uniref:Magnesium transport protein CorA n=1 Tax=Thermoflavimicrobium dichotomicum TaxID=46223 RepID=A0A1I3T9H1_9BACL|nr:magnesium/cobalt transporter CorA [Thermoflavimicrobium dichotomicum]SFJ67213.1 magnesium transporter [Thermoflavimicrobium dichotomicum]